MLRFKQDKDKMLFSLLHPALIMIYADMYLYAKEKYNVELVITDTISTPDQDAALGRVSTSHQEGRAIDIRTKYPNDALSVYDVQELCNYINTRWQYKKYHYVSRSGVNRLAYYHTHRGEHIHLAIHQRYKNHLLQKHVADLVH